MKKCEHGLEYECTQCLTESELLLDNIESKINVGWAELKKEAIKNKEIVDYIEKAFRENYTIEKIKREYKLLGESG